MGKTLNLSIVFAICLFASSCIGNNKNCHNVACTAIFGMVTVTVTDSLNNKVALDENYTVRQSNNDTIRNLNSTIDTGVYVVLDDNFTKSLENTQDEFRFIGIKDSNVVVNEVYTIGADCCHIDKKSGTTSVTIQ